MCCSKHFLDEIKFMAQQYIVGCLTLQLLTSSQVIDSVVAILFLPPESEVLFKELNDAPGIAEIILLELVNLVESILQCLVSKIDSFSGLFHGLVVEYGEVKGKAEFDGVARRECDFHCIPVGLKGTLLHCFEFTALSVFSHVAVVVSLHLDEEAFGLTIASLVENVILDDIDNKLTISRKLLLNRGLVARESISEFGVLRVLFDSLDSSACGTL